jgi:hypothetical protein
MSNRLQTELVVLAEASAKVLESKNHLEPALKVRNAIKELTEATTAEINDENRGEVAATSSISGLLNLMGMQDESVDLMSKKVPRTFAAFKELNRIVHDEIGDIMIMSLGLDKEFFQNFPKGAMEQIQEFKPCNCGNCEPTPVVKYKGEPALVWIDETREAHIHVLSKEQDEKLKVYMANLAEFTKEVRIGMLQAAQGAQAS